MDCGPNALALRPVHHSPARSLNLPRGENSKRDVHDPGIEKRLQHAQDMTRVQAASCRRSPGANA
jgi:hypothetical protein